ncbi:inactive metallocarboxypeptidase ECM14 [Hyalella azteca]|uniref:Inactive metallocarboxypeptidase ECM14 n=1 Tax=Hyalella azteca TaxID=294128 RepID=A0A979FIK1_HYAAZ|nr:inactive metallocarboxypeptidase ECM14 [Hyalella azteca]
MIRFLALFAVVALASARVSYEGFQVWRLEVSEEQKPAFNAILEKHNMDVWGRGKDWIDVLVDPKLRHGVMTSLAAKAIHSSIMIQDVQPLIERDFARLAKKNKDLKIAFDDYNTWEEIEAYLAGLPASDDRTSLVSLGKTVEGRDLWQLKISVGAGKKAVWIDCGIHAREWIGPATCLWGIDFLLNNYGSDAGATALLDAYDLYVLPVNNPDGYAYTWSDDRLWRKNRASYPDNVCVGVDLNRNFEDHFGGAGTSDDSCSETYRGPSAASEPETQHVQAAITALASEAAALFSIHSYSQLWMYPYGYTSDLPPDAAELDRISAIGVEALTAVHGTAYQYGPLSSTLYSAASITIDYSYAAGITYSFTLELRDTGTYGFLLPAIEIVPTAEETWAGLIAGILNARQRDVTSLFSMIRFLALFTVVALASAKVSYEGFQVWRLEVSEEQKPAVNSILEEHNMDEWGEGKDWIDVLVDPKLRHGVMTSLAAKAIHSSILIQDVQRLIEQDFARVAKKNKALKIVFDDYNTWEEIEAYLAGLPASDDRTSLVSLGKTVEGRDLWQLKISVGAGKKAVWIDCGIHAREWIGQATCLWGIDFLLNNYGSDAGATALLDAYDLYFLPVNNPDGYAYTWSDDRLWRKNRASYPDNVCAGVDLNRNFDDHFGGAGTSGNSCSETYRGPSAASEPETQHVQAAITALAPEAAALFSIHSYSQLWMYPYGYTSDLPPDAAELDRVSAIGVEALTAVHGTPYQYGPVSTTIYPAASTTIDYSYAAGINYSFTLELRDTGTFGFLLPAIEIVPTAEETWAGLIAGILAIP